MTTASSGNSAHCQRHAIMSDVKATDIPNPQQCSSHTIQTQSGQRKMSPLTPRGPRRPAAAIINGLPWLPHSLASEDDALNTPRKKIGRERTGGSDSARASSSPMRCSPSKRTSPYSSSSSSPSRQTSKRNDSRPTRRRSRTSSITSILVESLASVKCQEDCSSDGARAMTLTDGILSPLAQHENAENIPPKISEVSSVFSISTLQAVKVGLSKYTPLFKVLSEPWKADANKSAPLESMGVIRGHRRSSVWEDRMVPSSKESKELDLGTPFADRENASVFLDALVSKSNSKMEASKGIRARRGRPNQTSMLQGSPLQYLSSRYPATPRRASKKTTLPSEASVQNSDKLKKWNPLDIGLDKNNAASHKDSTAERESDMMNRQSSLSKEDWKSILNGGEVPSKSESVAFEIPPSLMPSIVITPPSTIEKTDTNSSIPLLHFPISENQAAEMIEKDGDIVMATADSMKEERSITSTSLEGIASPSLQAFQSKSNLEASYILRQCEDEQGIALYKGTIDKILSQYFVYRSAKRTWKLARQITEFLQDIFKLEEITIHGENSREKYAPFRLRELPIVSIPSLSAGRSYTLGKSGEIVLLATRQVCQSYTAALNIVLEHLVTGLIALVTDSRAPYETPQALGRLCMNLQKELPSAVSSKEAIQPISPLTNWVHDSLISSQRPESISISSRYDDEEVAWRQFLHSINISDRFVKQLHDTVQTILNRGEEIRLKSNLLAVPPPRKGSRKRWLMATQEINLRRIARDKAMNEVTRGIISEGDYRKLERQWAVIGNPKDSFAGLTLVRFIGELYVSQLLSVEVIRQWLFRFFVHTVFPMVPSSYELEAGCALLITIGETLDYEAGLIPNYEDDSSPLSSPEQVALRNHCIVGGTEVKIQDESMQGDVPFADAWTFIKSKTSEELRSNGDSCKWSSTIAVEVEGEKAEAIMSKKDLALDTINKIMKRIDEILDLEEIDNESRAWIREIIALRARHWQQSSSNHGTNSLCRT